MNEQAPIPSWSEFIQSAGGSFTDEQYDSLAQEYFQAAVAPRVSQDALPFTWAQFKSYVDANRPERGIISEFGRGVAHGGLSRAVGVAGTAAEAAELGAQHATPLVSPEGVAAAHRAEDAAVQMQREYQSPYQSARNVHGLYDAMRWGAANLGEFVGNWGPRLLATNPVTGAVTGPMVAAEIPVTTLGNVHAQARRGAEADSALKQTLAGPPPEQIDVSQAYRNIDQNKLAMGTMGSTALEYAQGVVGPFGKAFLPTGWAKGGTDLLSGAVNRGGALGAMAGKTALSAGGEGLTEGLQTFPEEYGAGTPDWTGPRVQAEALDQGLGAMVGAGGPSFIDASRGGMLGGAMDQLRGLRNPEYRPNYWDYSRGQFIEGQAPVPPGVYNEQFYTDPGLREQTRTALTGDTTPVSQNLRERLSPAPPVAAEPAAPPPDPLADLNALEALAPTAFDPKKKGEPPKQLSFPEFKSRVQAARTAAAKDITDDDIAAYNEATKDLDDAAKPKLADFKKSQMGEDPKDPQILKAYTQYRALWDAGHRSFATAKEQAKVDSFVGPQDLVGPRDPGTAPVFRDKATGQSDLFGATYGKDPKRLQGPTQYRTVGKGILPIPQNAPSVAAPPVGEQFDMFGVPLALTDESVATAQARARQESSPYEQAAWQRLADSRAEQRRGYAGAGQLDMFPDDNLPRRFNISREYEDPNAEFAVNGAPIPGNRDIDELAAEQARESSAQPIRQRRGAAASAQDLAQKTQAAVRDDQIGAGLGQGRTERQRDVVRETQRALDAAERQRPKVAPPDNAPTPLEKASQEVLRLEQERAEALQRLNEARDEGATTRELSRFNQELNAITNQLVKAKKQRTRLEEERDRAVQSEIAAGRQVTNEITRPPSSPIDPRYIRAGVRRTDILRSLKNGLRAPWIGKAGRKSASGRIAQLITKGTIEPGEWSVVALPGSPKSAPYYVIRKDQEAPNETTVQEAQPTADAAAQETGVINATGNTAGAPAENSGTPRGTPGTSRGERGSRRRADVAGRRPKSRRTAGSPKQRATPTGEPGDNGQSESALGSPNYIAMNLDDLPNQGNESLDNIRGETGIEFSRNESAPTQGTTASAVKGIVKQLTGRETSLKVVTHATRAAAEKALGRKLDPKAKAFVLNGQAHFILDQIAPGSELAVFLHEVGAHLGMERLLTQAEQDRLYGAIERWAQSGSGVEKAAAQAALRRSQGNRQEAIAYFIEEAVNRGVNPTALDMKSPLGRWFQQLWSAFKRALRTLGINTDQLSARDVVDLAYGAAGIELEGNTSNNDDIRYSLTDAETKEQLFSALDKPWEGMKEWFVQAHKLPLLAEWFSELPALKDISKLEGEMQKTYEGLADKVMARLDDIRELDDGVQAKLFKLMLDSTLWRIHPDAGFQVGSNAHLQAKDKARYDEVRQAWDALPAEARKIYQQMRDTFQEQFDLRQKALVELAQKYMGAKAARRFARNLDILRKQSPGPYFPLVRFGEHVAVWKSKELLQAEQDEDLPKIAQLRQDENHYKVDFFDSERQALNQLNAWIKAGGDRSAPAGEPDDRFQGSHYTRRAPFIQGLNSGMTGLLDKMGQSLDNTFSSSAEKEAAKNALAEAFLSSLPDSSIFRSAMKRESIAGIKPEQMDRALAFHGGSQAFHISRLTHADDLQKAMERLKRQDAAAVMKGSKLSTYGPLSQIFVNSFASGAPSEFGRAMQKLTSASYYSTLATKPAFWLINAATPATTVIPWLSGRHSIGKGYTEWWKAMTDVFPILTPKSIKDYLRFSFTDAFQNSKLAPDEKKMLTAVAEAGAIDQSQIREMTQVAQGQRGRLDTAMRFLGGMAHRAEVMSRAASALTAYRLEKERTKSEDAATQYAIEAVNAMLVNYSMAHAPLIFRRGGKLGSPAAKMIFQYARYSASIGQELVHLARKWKNGDEEAKRQFLTLMAVNTLVAGTNGWLGAEAIKFAVETAVNLFLPDDDELDIDAEVKKIMDKHFGKSLSLAARRGLPALTGLDLSESLGFQKVFNVRSESPFSAETKDEFALKLMSSAPAVGWALNIYDYIQNPDSKRVPISIVANTAKAIEQGQYGMVSRNGITKIKPEEYSTVDLILQGLGLLPTINAEGYQVQNSERIAKKHVAATKQDLLREYHVALKRKDGAAAKEVMAKIKAFQSRHPGDKEARIDQRTLQKSERQRKQREESMNEYGVEQ